MGRTPHYHLQHLDLLQVFYSAYKTQYCFASAVRDLEAWSSEDFDRCGESSDSGDESSDRCGESSDSSGESGDSSDRW